MKKLIFYLFAIMLFLYPSAFATTISGSLNICTGITTTLTIDTSGGTWSSGNTARATMVSGTGAITGVSPGTVTISYNLPGATFTAIVSVATQPFAIVGAGTLCEATTVGLTNPTSGSGTWTSSNAGVATIGTGSGVVSGIAAGTTTITYTMFSGCFTTRVETVNTAPTSIVGNSTMCVGTTQTFTCTPGSGTWTSSAPSVASVGSASGVVNGLIGGGSVISYSLSNGCRSTLALSVSNLPGAITGSLSLCMGNPGTLNSTTSGGTWSSGTIPVATVGSSTGIVTPVSVGTSTVTYTLGSSCTRTAIVTVNAGLAGNTGSPVVCIGQTTTLANATTGGTWSSSNTAKATVGLTSGIVTGIGAGTANISYKLSTGCSAITLVTVNITPAAITGSTSVCIGETITLSHITSGGIWTSSNSALATIDGSTGVVSGIAAGALTITYTLSPGCYKTLAILVRALPAAISGTMVLCPGAGAVLTDGTTGGTWSSSAPGVATIGSSGGLLTAVSTGTSTITYVVTSTGCYTTRVATVNAAPDAGAITGPSSVDIGATISLADAVGGGTWSSSNTAVATVGTTGVVAGVAAGTAVITYSVTNSCGTARAMHTVTVNMVVTTAITGTFAVCVSATTTLNNATSGGTWSSSNTGVATIGFASGIVTGITTGTATITYAIGSSFVTAVVTVTSTPDAGVITGASSVSVGATITLSDTVVGGTWSSSNTAVATVVSSGVVTGVAVGSVAISYTLSNECGSAFTTKTITVDTGCGDWVNVGSAGFSAGPAWYTSIAIDPSGTPFVVYKDISNSGKATVMKYNGTSWVTVGSAGFSGGEATQTIVAMNSSGVPYVVYQDGSNGYKATVMKYNGTNWVTVGSAGFSAGVVYVTYITIGNDGTPYVAYQDVANGSKATVMKFDGSDWVPVGTPGFSAGLANSTSIAISHGGIPYIVYSDYADGQKATVMKFNGSDWETVGSAGFSIGGVGGTNIAINSSGTPYVVYGDFANDFKATVMKFNGSIWEPVGSAGLSAGEAGHTSIAIDNLDAIYIGYYDGAYGNRTTVKKYNSTTWETVGSVGFSAGDAIYTYVVLDGAGTPYVVYRDNANSEKSTVMKFSGGISVISGTSSVFVGSTITLTNATPGGTWSSSNTSIATVGSTGVVTGIAAGSVVISYMVSGGCGSAVATKNVTVNTTCTSLITTISGNGTSGFSGDGGPATAASLNNPWGLTVDGYGNIFFADQVNQRVRKINTSGIITTIAGNGSASSSGDGGAATSAGLYNPHCVAADISGNVYVSDFSGNRIRKINSAGTISTIAGTGTGGMAGDGGTATAAQINGPVGVAIDGSGNIYFSDYGNYRVRKIDNGGTISTISTAGGQPRGLCVDGSGNVYVAQDDQRVRKINPEGIITIIAGTGSGGYSGDGGPATGAQLNAPQGVAVDAGGNIYIAEESGHRIRKINSTGTITTLAGNGIAGYSGDGGPASDAQIHFGNSVAVDAANSIFISDIGNNRIRKITIVGLPSVSPITGPTWVAIGSTITLSSTATGGSWSSSNTSVAIVGSTGIVTGMATGSAVISYTVTNGCGSATQTHAMIVNPACSPVITTFAGNGAAGYSGDHGQATTAELSYPTGITTDNADNIYIADALNNRIRKVSPSGVITTFAGTGSAGYSGDGGPATAAELNWPWGLATDGSGNIYISELVNHRIRKVSVSGIITTVAGTGTAGYSGDGSSATAAQLNTPYGIAFDNAGNLYIGDGGIYSGNGKVRKINTSGIITTIAGGGGTLGDGGPATAARLSAATGILVDAVGNIYISDNSNGRVRKITTSGIITTFAGNGSLGYSGDEGPAIVAQLNNPYGLSTDAIGNIYIADYGNNRIRKVNSAGIITSFAGTGISAYSGDGGLASLAEITHAAGIFVDAPGNVYIADEWGQRVRRVYSTIPYAGMITGVSTIATGTATTFSSSVSGGVWLSSNPSKATVGATTGVVTGMAAGFATIYYSVANSCGIASASHGITVTGTGSRPGIGDDGTTLFSVYPNPTTGALTILSGIAGTVVIYTIDGRMIDRYAVTTDPTALSLPANIASGIYLLKFTGDNGSSKVVRLVYER